MSPLEKVDTPSLNELLNLLLHFPVVADLCNMFHPIIGLH